MGAIDMKCHRFCLIMLLSLWPTGAWAGSGRGLPTSGMVVALVSRVTGSDFFSSYRMGAERTAAALGMTLLVIPAGTTEGSQRAAVERAIGLKARGVILNDVVGPDVDAVLAPAFRVGMPVVSFDSTETDPRVVRVGQDDAAMARLVARQALVDHKGAAQVLVAHVTGFPETDRRYAAWQEIVGGAGWRGRTLETPSTGDVRRQAEDGIARAIRRDPAVDVVYAPWDQLAYGAVAALRNMAPGAGERRAVYGSDITDQVIRELGRKGTPWVATAGTNPSVLGAVCVRTLALRLTGVAVGTPLVVAPVLLTAGFVQGAGVRSMEDLERTVPAFAHSPVSVAAWMPDSAR
ncbi:substrate-binding domain-containing protein [Gluconacetobacter sp. Hr-1-5]|uniref:substrate-binding domain-containing protein n=1 Tax=Gluconacetobacter sp. Hr-1-5 TaxID=3395370 RepID=UPI003B51C513